LPIVTYEIYLSRDPFDPVVPEPTSAATSGGAEATQASGAIQPSLGLPDPEDPADPADPIDPTDPNEDVRQSGCRGEAEVICDGRVVTLIGIRDDGEPRAAIQVDTTVYDVGVGDRFAEYFQVRSIEGGCANLLYGDDGFRVCEGDRVLK
jgi:hypothetical protein